MRAESFLPERWDISLTFPSGYLRPLNDILETSILLEDDERTLLRETIAELTSLSQGAI